MCIRDRDISGPAGPVYSGTESLEEVVKADEGATLVLEEKAALEIPSNTFSENVTVSIEQAAPDSFPLSDDMTLLGTPVALSFTTADGQPLQRDYESTRTFEVSFNLDEYAGDPEDLTVVLVDPDGVVWYVESTYDESSNTLSADVAAYALGSESAFHQGAQLQGVGSFLKKTWAGFLNIGDESCQDDDHAQLKLVHGGSASSIPVIFLHGWQPKQYNCQKYQETEPFVNLRKFLLTKEDIRDNFSFYTFHYPTYHAPDHNAELLNRRITAQIPSAQDSIVLICHSMGGLVGRYWMEEFGRDSDVVRIITCGTPHRGSPLASMGTSTLTPTPGAKSLVINSPVLTTLEDNEGIIDERKYRMYYGKIEGTQDQSWSAWAGSKLLSDCSDGIVPCTRAWLWPKMDFHNKELSGYNHFEMHEGDSQTAAQFDPLFRDILADLLEILAKLDIEMVSIPGGTFHISSSSYITFTWSQVEVSDFQISATAVSYTHLTLPTSDLV